MRKFGHGYRISRKWYSRSYLKHCTDKFGFMFPGLARRSKKVLPFSAATLTALDNLGQEIGSKLNTNDSNIPAGYTYLGQFIDHDITLDPFSNIDVAHTAREVEQLNNFRTPGLDLDSLYGRGPSVDPYLYVMNSGDPQEDGVKLLLGSNSPTGNGGPRTPSGRNVVPTNFDLPRTTSQTAIIGDPRNNENLIISQLHHAFLKFHNSVVDHLKGNIPDNELFDTARRKVIDHYQWIVIHDFLKRVADPNEVDASLQNQRFFRRRPFRMPVEFAVGAYRFGHSMVRESYELNDSSFNPASMMQVFEFAAVPRLPVFSNWALDFNRFFDTGSTLPVNLAKAFDTALAPDLSNLPGHPPGSFMAHLAKRNLKRSVALRVPTGQAIAKRMNISQLTNTELLQNTTTAEEAALKANSNALLKKTPLWYYILKEAEVRENGQRLGKVGSRILAETFTRILRENPSSILHSGTTPDLPRIPGKPAGGFDMADLLKFAGVLEQ